MMTTDDDFIAAICREPERDDVRLVFADFLEENGDGERAELIRVGCELATVGPCQDECRNRMDYECRGCDLRRREQELLRVHAAFWGADLPLPACPENGVSEWRRGFVDAIAVTLAEWIGRECEGEECSNCDGTGVRGYCKTCRGTWNMRHPWECCYKPIQDRPCEFCKGTRHDPDCTICHGTGRIAGIGPRVVRCQPVTRVTLTDRRPAQWQTASEGEEQWTWAEENAIGDSDYPARLPRDLFALLRAPVSSAGDTVRYGSEADAHADLSAAALRWARAEADRREGVTV